MPISYDFVARLKPNERKVVRLAAEGMTDRAIAQRLNYSPCTVSTYLWRAAQQLPRRDSINPRVATVIAYLEGTGKLRDLNAEERAEMNTEWTRIARAGDVTY